MQLDFNFDSNFWCHVNVHFPRFKTICSSVRFYLFNGWHSDFFSLVSSVQFDAQVWADAARRLPLPPDHHCKIQGWNFQEKDTGRVWSYKTDSLLHWSMCYKVSTRTYQPVSILLETMWIVCWGPHYRTLAGWKNIGQPWNASRLLDMTEIYKLFCCFLQLIPKFSSIFRNFMIEVNPNELQVCKEARNYFTCQRPLHVAWLIYSILQYSQWIEGIQNWGQNPFRLCEALDIYTTAMHCGTLNVSQNIDRMTHGDRERVQCITPKVILWHPPSKRPLSGRINTTCPNRTNISFDTWLGMEKFMFMGFPIHRLSLDHLTEEDVTTIQQSMSSELNSDLESTRLWFQELHSLAGNALTLHVVLTVALNAFCNLSPPIFAHPICTFPGHECAILRSSVDVSF